MKIIHLILLSSTLALCSCHKEKLSEIPQADGVYLVNEGNFNFGNSDISFYNPKTQQLTNGLFQIANSFSLGDVAQSLYIRDSIGFIVVNNSAKIEIVSIPSFKKIRTITIPNSAPRYLLPINDSIAYVTELYAHKVYVINYRSGVWQSSISVPQYTEHLVQSGDFVFVEGKRIYAEPASRGCLLRIAISQQTLTDSIRLNGDAAGIARDKDGNVWIAVNADSTLGGKSALLCYNKQLQELKRFDLSAPVHPANLCADERGENLFFLSGGVFRFRIADSHLIQLISSTSPTLYALGVAPSSGDIYVSDALDFVQSSRIFRYAQDGTLIHSFTAGVNTGNFVFSNE